MNNLYARSVIEYCERSGDFFWAEPINFLSNGMFFVAAYFAFKFLQKKKLIQKYGILVWTLAAIGFGSAAWHSFRNPFTHALDFVPVYIFIFAFLFFTFEKLFKNKQKAAIVVVGFIIIQLIVSSLFPTVLNGSIRHVVNGLFFAGLVTWIALKARQATFLAIAAFTIFIMAVLFRSVDQVICTSFPMGTHFLWHIFTAVAAYLAVEVLGKLQSQAH